jgi:hypothetical protein
VRSEEVQYVMQQLQGANIIIRSGHGAYTVVGPFVREMGRERKAQPSRRRRFLRVLFLAGGDDLAVSTQGNVAAQIYGD